MTWRQIIVGAVAGFAWLVLIRGLMAAGAVPAGAGASWLTFGGLAAVWAAVLLLFKPPGR